MPTKKRKTYKQCSNKDCKKKAISAGKCRVHAGKKPTGKITVDKTTKSSPKKAVVRKIKKISPVVKSAAPVKRTVAQAPVTPHPKKIKRKRNNLGKIFYQVGVAAGRINKLIES